MKRILKKVMPALLTLAMVFTMVAVPSVKAKAADGDYYILGDVPSATWNTESGAKMKDDRKSCLQGFLTDCIFIAR